MKTRAAVLTEVNKPLQIMDLELEGPKAGEALVKVRAAGVCMSDWHIMIGDWPLPLPMILGHEAAGEVVEVGAGVTHIKKGDHVIFSFRPNCGHCPYCARGRSVLCIGRNDTSRFVMHDGTTRVKLNGEPLNIMARIGTFTEHAVCPAEQLVAVRKDLPWTHAAIIGCSVATGVGAVVRHAKISAGSTVLVVGCGGVGLNVIQGAKLAGAKTIIACDLLDNKLQLATHFGATHIINGKTQDVIKTVMEITKLGVDYAFDAIGTGPTVVQIVDALAPAGHAVIVGIPAFSATAPVAPSAMVYSEKTLSGTYYGSINPVVDFGVLADLSMDKQLNLDDLISRTYKLDEINEGFQLMAKGQVARGVITFD